MSSFGQFLALIKAYLLISRLQVDNQNFAKICEMIIQIIQDSGPTLAKDSSVDVDSAERFRAESPSCFVTGFPAKREATASHQIHQGHQELQSFFTKAKRYSILSIQKFA